MYGYVQRTWVTEPGTSDGTARTLSRGDGRITLRCGAFAFLDVGHVDDWLLAIGSRSERSSRAKG